jgi:probable phosphoglycerate mutase
VLPVLRTDRLVLWRHGRTAWNADGRFQGQLDPPLDDVGRDQAVRTAPQLAAAAAPGGLDPAGTVVVASDLRRAVETATALTTVLGVDLRLDRRLREHSLGTWEGLTRDEVVERFPEQYADWVAGRPVSGRGGEQPAQVVERALAALADLPPADVVVAVTHGGTTRRLLEALLGLGAEQTRVLGPLSNCGWSELALREGRWQLVRHNSSLPSRGAAHRSADGRPLRAVPDGGPAVTTGRERAAEGPTEDADAAV